RIEARRSGLGHGGAHLVLRGAAASSLAAGRPWRLRCVARDGRGRGPALRSALVVVPAAPGDQQHAGRGDDRHRRQGQRAPATPPHGVLTGSSVVLMPARRGGPGAGTAPAPTIRLNGRAATLAGPGHLERSFTIFATLPRTLCRAGRLHGS